MSDAIVADLSACRFIGGPATGARLQCDAL